MHRQFSAALVLFMGTLFSVNAWAKDANVLTSVEFTGVADYIEFAFETKTPPQADSISARIDGTVLVLRLEETQVKRRWIKVKDSQIKRTLLHPSRGSVPAANLRVRFFKTLDEAIIRNIRVRVEGDRLIAAIPRNATIANAWAGKSAPASNVEQKTRQAMPTQMPGTAQNTESAVEQVAMGPMPLADVVPSPEDIPLGLPADDEAVAVTSSEKAPENMPVASGLAQASTDKLGMGAIAMSLLFLLGVGFVLWRRMRVPGAEESVGPMIRPVGTHMLGPKQGLLLVEVAGDMVLLGTGEKGVQMLTKIEGKPSADAEPVGPRVEPLSQPIDHNAVENAARPAFTERLGNAIDRIREAAGAASVRSQSYSSIHDDATSDLDDENSLEEFAGRRDDVNLSGAAKRSARRQFAPVEPQRPEPIYGAQPPVNDSDDLLNKLRNLQSA